MTGSPAVFQSPAVPYVVPFAVFMALIGLSLLWPLPPLSDQLLRLAIMAAVLWWVARPALKRARLLAAAEHQVAAEQ